MLSRAKNLADVNRCADLSTECGRQTEPNFRRLHTSVSCHR